MKTLAPICPRHGLALVEDINRVPRCPECRRRNRQEIATLFRNPELALTLGLTREPHDDTRRPQ